MPSVWIMYICRYIHIYVRKLVRLRLTLSFHDVSNMLQCPSDSQTVTAVANYSFHHDRVFKSNALVDEVLSNSSYQQPFSWSPIHCNYHFFLNLVAITMSRSSFSLFLSSIPRMMLFLKLSWRTRCPTILPLLICTVDISSFLFHSF